MIDFLWVLFLFSGCAAAVFALVEYLNPLSPHGDTHETGFNISFAVAVISGILVLIGG